LRSVSLGHLISLALGVDLPLLEGVDSIVYGQIASFACAVSSNVVLQLDA